MHMHRFNQCICTGSINAHAQVQSMYMQNIVINIIIMYMHRFNPAVVWQVLAKRART